VSLEDLERRLRDEPSNLGLRVSLAGALHEAGRTGDAVELYRSVAMAYREQGRTKQAIAVCHSILEIAPDDPVSRALLASLGEPDRRSSLTGDQTPLPIPVPYHVADPTTRLIRKLSEASLQTPDPDGAARTQPSMRVDVADDDDAPITLGDDHPITLGDEHGIDVAAELETRERPRIAAAELLAVTQPPPTAPVSKVHLEPDDIPTPVALDDRLILRDTDRDFGEVTNPNQPAAPVSQTVLSGALFATIPAPHRATVLTRFRRKHFAAGATVIRVGETDHPLVVVGRGELAVRIEREDGRLVTVHDVVAGDHAGEGTLLSRTPAEAHVIAVTPCELLLLTPHDFYEIAGAFPAMWTRLKDVAERRARERDALNRASP
jgi:Cyclic nucleotide-binding domain